MNIEKEGEYVNSLKKKEWSILVKKVKKLEDALGMPIDKRITKLVTALIANGFTTYGSCEGHTNHSMGAPWVEIGAPGEPIERFVGENDALTQSAKDFGFDLEIDKIRGMKDRDLFVKIWESAQLKCRNNPETRDFKKWRRETKKLHKKMEIILDSFYENRNKSNKVVEIKIILFSCGRFRIFSGGKNWMKDDFMLVKFCKTGHGARLKTYQNEMNCFAEFLKNLYLTSSTQ